MSISDLAAWGEFLSSIVVLVTLVYLTIEIRQNTNALKTDSRLAALDGGHKELFTMLENPDIITNIIKQGSLTQEEQIRLCAFLFAIVRTREFSWGQYRDGVIDDQQWATEVNVTRIIFDSSRTREWWVRYGRFVYSLEFVQFVEELLEKQPPTEKAWQGYANWAQNDVGWISG